MKLVVALLILIIALSVAAPAYAQTPDAPTSHSAGTNSVSGVVFYDVDGDGIQGPFEDAVPHAIVNIQEVVDGVPTDLIESMITNEDGYFDTGEIEHGEYHVWTEVDGQASPKALIDIGELNGTAVVALGIARSFDVLLPFVSS